MPTRTRSCSKVETKLALGAAVRSSSLIAHIETCPSCRSAVGAHERVTSGLLTLAGDEAGLRLNAARRSLILREVRSFSAATPSPGFSARFVAWPDARSRVPAYATLLAAFLILGFAYLTSSAPVPDLSPRSARHAAQVAGPIDVRVTQEGGDVVLEWSDGRQASYTVRQATSARAVYSARGVQVRGHRYEDRSPSNATVVYYLVE